MLCPDYYSMEEKKLYLCWMERSLWKCGFSMRNAFASLTVTSKLDSQSDTERLRTVSGGQGS